MQFYTYNEIRKDESGNSWWEQIILRPFVHKLTWLFANYTKFTPNQITIISFIFGLLSAYSFLQGERFYLIIGAILYEISFLLDCIDGRIARLKGLKSRIGGYLDIMTDIIKYSFIIVCLVYSQFLKTEDISLFLYGYLFMSLELIALTSKYIIYYHTNKKDTIENRDMRTNFQNRFPLLMKLKSNIDPENKLGFLPLSAIEAETFVFFIFPIIMKVKLGIIIGSIILFLDIIAITIFNFLIKK